MSLDEVNAFLDTPTGTRSTLPDRADILARIDLEALFMEHGYPQGRNKQWTCPDPQHAQSGATPPVKISVVGDRQVWYCHGCGANGSAVDLLLATGATERDALATLAARAGLSDGAPPAPAARIARTVKPAKPAGPLEPNHGRIDGPEGQTILEAYLTERHWTPEAAEAFGLTAVRNPAQGIAIRHPYRADGETVWYQDRGREGKGPKWSNPAGHPRTIHALDLAETFHIAAKSDPPHMYVVEGPADVIALWHINPGFPVIGMPGTGSVSKWAALLVGMQVLILTDPDEAGDQAGLELALAVDAAGGWGTRLRPPSDLADWLVSAGPDEVRTGIIALADLAQQRIDAAL